VYNDLQKSVTALTSSEINTEHPESQDSVNKIITQSALWKLDPLDFGRRMAVEREIDTALPPCPPPNAVFDTTGNFIIFPSLIGIKIINIVTNKVARVLGKAENTERFLAIALYQSIDYTPTEQDLMLTNNVAVSQRSAEQDFILICAAFKKHRFYVFSRREPTDGEGDEGRDVFNERPTREEQSNAPSSLGSKRLSRAAIIHSSLGDIHVKLFPDECPRTVENFITHSKNGYYNGLIFHRVIKGFMVQTGDPLGDGTGGASIWGPEFEDEFHRSLRHDRPFTISMANAGPDTNGSQFFITTVATPWLDNKHTVFARVVKGMDVVQAIEKVKTDKNDKPAQDVKIISITVQ